MTRLHNQSQRPFSRTSRNWAASLLPKCHGTNKSRAAIEMKQAVPSRYATHRRATVIADPRMRVRRRFDSAPNILCGSKWPRGAVCWYKALIVFDLNSLVQIPSGQCRLWKHNSLDGKLANLSGKFASLCSCNGLYTPPRKPSLLRRLNVPLHLAQTSMPADCLNDGGGATGFC